MRRFICLLILLCIPFCSTAQGNLSIESLQENHVTGQFFVGGHAIVIDARLIPMEANAGEILFTVDPKEETTILKAINACFSSVDSEIQSNMYIKNELFSSYSKGFETAGGLFPRISRYTEIEKDAFLQGLENECIAFLEALNLSYDPIALSVSYYTIDPLSGLAVRISTDDAEKLEPSMRFAEVWLMPSFEDLPLIPFLQTTRYNGALKHLSTNHCILFEAYTNFYFSGDGQLKNLHVATVNAKKHTSLSAENLLAWEDALGIFLSEYTQLDRIRNNLETMTYFVTSIRPAWGPDGNNIAVPGWYISLAAEDPSIPGNTMLYNARHFSAFVHGEKLK